MSLLFSNFFFTFFIINYKFDVFSFVFGQVSDCEDRSFCLENRKNSKFPIFCCLRLKWRFQRILINRKNVRHPKTTIIRIKKKFRVSLIKVEGNYWRLFFDFVILLCTSMSWLQKLCQSNESSRPRLEIARFWNIPHGRGMLVVFFSFFITVWFLMACKKCRLCFYRKIDAWSMSRIAFYTMSGHFWHWKYKLLKKMVKYWLSILIIKKKPKNQKSSLRGSVFDFSWLFAWTYLPLGRKIGEEFSKSQNLDWIEKIIIKSKFHEFFFVRRLFSRVFQNSEKKLLQKSWISLFSSISLKKPPRSPRKRVFSSRGKQRTMLFDRWTLLWKTRHFFLERSIHRLIALCRPTLACSAWPSILTRDTPCIPAVVPSCTVVRGVAKCHPTFSPSLMELT